MKRIVIEFVPQHKQRYPTLGDYGETEHNIWFKITEFKNPLFSIAILIHEIWEFYRCKLAGVKITDIDAFDLEHTELDEPGMSPEAPYHRQHCEADALERTCIAFSGATWSEYELECEKMFPKETPCIP